MEQETTQQAPFDLDLTETAITKTKELLTKAGKENHGLRINVLPGGCSGFKYDFQFEAQATDEDIVLDKQGLKVFVNKNITSYLKSVRVDYVEALQGAGFKVENPNAQSGCGCGKSFA